jgi:quercetin dioxygenase-like cupin family protein
VDKQFRMVWAAAILVAFAPSRATAQLESPCVANSPERRGEFGCSLVEIKALPPGLAGPIVWHIDRFKSLAAAQAAVSPTSIALEAHGGFWLLNIERTTTNHHGGEHVTEVQLPPLPPADKYALLVISAYVPGGQYSRIHLHSGVEAFYTVDGEQCLETATRIYPMPKGATAVVPTGEIMRLVSMGTVPRRNLAVVVYDAAQPPTTRLESAPALLSCNPKNPG